MSQNANGNDNRRRVGAIDTGTATDDASAITMPTQLQGTVITTPSSSGANMSQSQPGNAGN
jgi:hypothetical protein